ncbi:hypothetical protein [Desulfocurvus vexinensis]|uniref:hypothetical protein n=1 Tax=Desulfocurvus vexinensis TaxID=399548 RepID=UPI000490BF15|nr:hypothetical protein [Desulfocurvus vexinensis]
MSCRISPLRCLWRLVPALGLALALVLPAALGALAPAAPDALAPSASAVSASGPGDFASLARSASWRGPAPRAADQDLFALRYRLLRADPGRLSPLPTACEACIAAAVDAGAGMAEAASRCRLACGLP